jgi:hypothetical protein
MASAEVFHVPGVPEASKSKYLLIADPELKAEGSVTPELLMIKEYTVAVGVPG